MKTIRMPKELLAKWLAALRSGEYKQAQRLLHDKCTGGYCCLGVLQVVACGGVVSDEDEEVPDRRWLEDHEVKFSGRVSSKSSDPWLPSIELSAATANDEGRTFAEIADAIEACAEGV